MCYSLKKIVISFLIVIPSIAAAVTDTTKEAVIGHVPVITQVTIDKKSPNIGDTVTVSATVTDPDGDSIIPSQYQWLLNGTEIPGAIKNSFKLDFKLYSSLSPGSYLSVKIKASTDPNTTAPYLTEIESQKVIVSNPLVPHPAVFGVVGQVGLNVKPIGGNGDAKLYKSSNPGIVAVDNNGNLTLLTVGAATMTVTEAAHDSYEAQMVTTEVTVNNSAPVAENVKLNNLDPTVGDTLVGTYSYRDADSDKEGGTKFLWYRDTVAIAGQLGKTYTTTPEDKGHKISFAVVPVAQSANQQVGAEVAVQTEAVWGAWPPLRKSGVLPRVETFYTVGGRIVQGAESVETLMEGGNGMEIRLVPNPESNDVLGGTLDGYGTEVFRYLSTCVTKPLTWNWPTLTPADHVTLSVVQADDQNHHVRGGNADLSYPCDKYIP